MNIYVYSDESGVFDKVHNDKFVFGGLIILGTANKQYWEHRYNAVESPIYIAEGIPKSQELKAAKISNKSKGKLYRSLNSCYKFGAVVDQKRVLDRIFSGKKDKQRYLDYVFKIAVKRAFQDMITQNIIAPKAVDGIFFFVDEHTTATNGKYELREALEQEFRFGTYNNEWNIFYPPIFPTVKCIDLEFCNSEKTTLVRAADIVANRIYYISLHGSDFSDDISNRCLYITNLP